MDKERTKDLAVAIKRFDIPARKVFRVNSTTGRNFRVSRFVYPTIRARYVNLDFALGNKHDERKEEKVEKKWKNLVEVKERRIAIRSWPG